jgi:hypothetical protein
VKDDHETVWSGGSRYSTRSLRALVRRIQPLVWLVVITGVVASLAYITWPTARARKGAARYNPLVFNCETKPQGGRRSGWTRVPSAPISPRAGAVTAWACGHLFVWGGTTGVNPAGLVQYPSDGAAFDASRGVWELVQRMPNLGAERATVWTGKEVITWGGVDETGFTSQGAAYNPRTGQWRVLPKSPFLSLSSPTAVWDGHEVLVLVSSQTLDHWYMASYTPARNRWSLLSSPPLAPRAPSSCSVVWTGTHLIVWGGAGATTTFDDGAIFDPSDHRWRIMAQTPLAARSNAATAWTGTEMVVSEGNGTKTLLSETGAFSPSLNRWRRLPDAPLSGRQYSKAVWTGSRFVVWGGIGTTGSFADGAQLDPMSGKWTMLPLAPLQPRYNFTMWWTDDGVLIFGGDGGGGRPTLNDGAVLVPDTRS